MSFRFSANAVDRLSATGFMVEDRRNNPVRGRDTKFRLNQQNMLAYTFDENVPGWGASDLSSRSFREIVLAALLNADLEGRHRWGDEYEVKSSAKAKVAGDGYEVLTSAVLWNAAARWNRFMCGEAWPRSPRYPLPAVSRSEKRQVAVLNLPRRYNWVKLLDAKSAGRVDKLLESLEVHNLAMPTSTPDLAIVVLPDELRDDDMFRTSVPNLSLENQAMLSGVHKRFEGVVEPGEIILAMALKASLRSDRLYQPLYEANVMQFILEGHLGAPRVDFEVHCLSTEGTRAAETYKAASFFSANSSQPHRAIRELYVPLNAREIVERFYGFLNARMESVGKSP